MKTRPTGRRAIRGFTLFEVLAAVAILGFLYIVLADIAISGTRFEGESKRRLRAALLADQALGDLERGFALGAAPPVGSNESEEDDFTIATEVRAFDLAGFAATLADSEDPKASTGAQPGGLLAAPAQGPPPILEIEVVVGWIEGNTPLEIRRLTYGFDLAAAGGLLEDLPGREDQPDGEGAALGPGGAPVPRAPGRVPVPGPPR